jgi:hypothetical protein
MERALFIAGIALVAFFYGAFSVQYQVFPYSLLREAKLGLEAWAAVDRNNSRFPKAFERFEKDAPPRPQAKQLAASSGAEQILVTGGPFQLLERCPRWGCIAWIADRDGRVLHTWEVDLDQLWQGLSGVSGDVNALSLYPVGMVLGADGSLVVSFQGRETFPVQIGIARIDRDGRIVWKRFDGSHHWITTDADGNIYAPAAAFYDRKYVGQTAIDVPCKAGTSWSDNIRVLDPNGNPLREVPIMEAFLRAGYAGHFYNLRDACNPTHLNSIALAPASLEGKLAGAAAGDLLVSLRETNTVALLDGKTGALKHALSGRTGAQHSAQFLPDGTVLAFDNLGGERSRGGTRVVRLDLVKRTAETVFPRDNAKELLPVESKSAGQIDVSSDGRRALVAITHQGRIVEIDVESGTPLWVYENTHDIGTFLEANGMSRQDTRARFATYGAYYVGSASFLKERPK